MSDKHYINEIGTEILVDCDSTITGATELKLKIKKPNGTEVEWDAAISGTDSLRYITIIGDFNQVGKYYLQSSLTIDGWTGLGETVSFFIYDEYH